jgi:spoIIIJ-associated protein
MKKVTATGRTIEDAVTSALVRLGATRSQATVRVINEPVKGLFGFFGAKDAQVEVSIVLTPEETAKEFLTGVVKRMGLEAHVRVRSGRDGERSVLNYEIICDEDDLPVVIGRHGSTLDSLQYLMNVVANQNQETYIKVLVDAGDYRRRRHEGLQRLADKAAVRALRTKRPVAMDPMPASDRKLIHTYLQDRSDVTTSSEGSDPHRKVLVLPVVKSGPGR